LASCGRINRSSVGELKVERSVGVSIQLKIVSERNVELLLERKVVNCVELKLENSVGAKYSSIQ
jgi:hypothetical protein